MTQRMAPWNVLCLLILLCGCSTVSSPVGSPHYFSELHVEDIFPKTPVAGIPDEAIREGIKAFSRSDFAEASLRFNQALRYDPRNSYLHFLNGLTYHLQAELGDSGKYESAKLGYELALKFDRNNHLASQQLAYFYLKSKKYRQAQDYFAQALLNQPENPELLYGLAKASYYAGDIETALGAARRAKVLMPKNPEIVSGHALISAALGDFAAADVDLAEFKTIESTSPRVERTEERLRDWKELHRLQAQKPIVVADAAADQADPWAGVKTDAKETAPSPSGSKQGDAISSSSGQTTTGTAPSSPDPKMVVIDVTMIRTEERENTNKGVNLMDGFKFVFGGHVGVDNLSSTGTAVAETFKRTLSGDIKLPDINYNLNIFNSGTDRSEVLARPTIIALDGKESKFFAGSVLNVALSGNFSSTLEKIETGVTLQVTPTFQPDGSILLSLLANRSSIDIEAPDGTFQNGTVTTSKNEISANVIMKFGQTLILSGLREKETSEGKSGVPLLMDIPGAQYLFSNKTTMGTHRSILILLTPRKVFPGVTIVEPETANEQEALKEFRANNPHLFEPASATVMRHVEKHKIIKEIRSSDMFDYIWWGNFDSLNTMLRRTLSFLYY